MCVFLFFSSLSLIVSTRSASGISLWIFGACRRNRSNTIPDRKNIPQAILLLRQARDSLFLVVSFFLIVSCLWTLDEVSISLLARVTIFHCEFGGTSTSDTLTPKVSLCLRSHRTTSGTAVFQEAKKKITSVKNSPSPPPTLITSHLLAHV